MSFTCRHLSFAVTLASLAFASGRDWHLCVLVDQKGWPISDWHAIALETWAFQPEINPTHREVLVWPEAMSIASNARGDVGLLAELVARQLRMIGVFGLCMWTLVLHVPVLLQLGRIVSRLRCLNELIAFEFVPPPEQLKDDNGIRAFRILSRGLVESAGQRNRVEELGEPSWRNIWRRKLGAHTAALFTEREVLLGNADPDLYEAVPGNEYGCLLAIEVHQSLQMRRLWNAVRSDWASNSGRMPCMIEAYQLPELVMSSLRACYLKQHFHVDTVDELLDLADKTEALQLPAGAEHTSHYLCVVFLVTFQQEVYLSQATRALETWAQEASRLGDVGLFFLLPENTTPVPEDVERYAIRLTHDYDVDYQHLPVRDLLVWHFFAKHPNGPRCEWVARVDTDTWVNLERLQQRLTCFKPWMEHYVGWPSLSEVRIGGLARGHVSPYLLNSAVLNRKLLSRMAAHKGFIKCLGSLFDGWFGEGLMDVTLSNCIFAVIGVWPEFLGDGTEIVLWETGPPLEHPVSDCIIFAHPTPPDLMHALQKHTVDSLVGHWSFMYNNGSQAVISITSDGLARWTNVVKRGVGTSSSARIYLLSNAEDRNGSSFLLRGIFPASSQIVVRIEDGQLFAEHSFSTEERALLGRGWRKVAISDSSCRATLPVDRRIMPQCWNNHTRVQVMTPEEFARSETCWHVGGVQVMERAWCCHELFGRTGNPACWFEAYTYDLCCLGKRKFTL